MTRFVLCVLGGLLAAGDFATSHASESCIASVYWEGFGRPLADGHRHRPDEILAAHRTLPFGSIVRVTVTASGRALDVPVRDRGPFVSGRCLDLSRGAARALGISGLARVRVDVVSQIRSSKSVEDQNPENLKIKPERQSK